MSKNFSVLFYSSENTEKMYFSFHKNIKQLIFSTLKIIIIINNGAQNQHIKMISDGSCDTEVMAAENRSIEVYRNKLQIKKENSSFRIETIFHNITVIFKQINGVTLLLETSFKNLLKIYIYIF